MGAHIPSGVSPPQPTISNIYFSVPQPSVGGAEMYSTYVRVARRDVATKTGTRRKRTLRLVVSEEAMLRTDPTCRLHSLVQLLPGGVCCTHETDAEALRHGVTSFLDLTAWPSSPLRVISFSQPQSRVSPKDRLSLRHVPMVILAASKSSGRQRRPGVTGH